MSIVRIIDGVPEETVRITTTDTAAELTDALKYKDADSTNIATINKAQGLLITVEVAAVRIGLGGAVPTQGVSGLGHELLDGDSIVLKNWEAINRLQHISSAAGVAGTLQITTEF